jgi:hypothetical protein
LNLLALILYFLLLLLHLLLGLRVGIFLILHRIADYVAGATAQKTTERGACQRMAHGCSDQCAAACTYRSAAERALFTSRKRLPRASCKNERSRERQTHDCCNTFAHFENLHHPNDYTSAELFGFLLPFQLLYLLPLLFQLLLLLLDLCLSLLICILIVLQQVAVALLGLAVRLKLLNLLLLTLNLLLLRIDLSLCLSLLIVTILHLVTDGVAAQRAYAATDSRASQRITDSSADNRAGRRPNAGADKCAFLTCREWLSRASHDDHNRGRNEQAFD